MQRQPCIGAKGDIPDALQARYIPVMEHLDGGAGATLALLASKASRAGVYAGVDWRSWRLATSGFGLPGAGRRLASPERGRVHLAQKNLNLGVT
jgi:hypothetical protein